MFLGGQAQIYQVINTSPFFNQLVCCKLTPGNTSCVGRNVVKLSLDWTPTEHFGHAHLSFSYVLKTEVFLQPTTDVHIHLAGKALKSQ